MVVNTDVLESKVRPIELDWRPLRAWAAKAFTKERIGDILLVAANLAGLGTILLFLAKATDIPTNAWLAIAGFGGF